MLVEALIRLLITEHKKRPICGNVLALGKQSIAVPLPKIKDIFHECDCEINPKFQEKYDESTRYRTGNLDDEAFFNIFGNVNYQTMDVSGYEKASIIHDLNKPISKELAGQFDYVIDGGTFDHLFDLKVCFENVTKLLKPGGRVFQWNAASNYANAGYLSFSADFFYDYYVLNKFANCRTFFAVGHSMDAQNWCFYEFIPPKNNKGYSIFKPSYLRVMVIVLAEKGMDSTSHRVPIQLQYRDKNLRNEYLRNSKEFESYSAGPLKLRTISLKQVKMPLRYKLLHLCEPSPCKNAYHKIGWL